MSSFLFEREEIHCSCFDSSPKNAPRIFRTDPQHLTKTKNNQTFQQPGRNAGQHSKKKKKSLKKERQLSNVGSERDPKQKDDIGNHIIIPDIQLAFNPYPSKRQHNTVGFQNCQQPAMMQVRTQRNRPVHNIRAQRPQVFFEPINFDVNYKIPQKIPTIIQSQKKILDDLEYDIKITQEFEKDFTEFKLQMDMIESQKQQSRISQRKKKEYQSTKKLTSQPIQSAQKSNPIRYPATQHIIPVLQNDKIQHRVSSFRGSTVSNKEKTSNKKDKDKIFPKQIQSQKGSSSQSQSDKESVFLGRGFDGLTEQRQSFQDVQICQKRKIETMKTQQSHIQHSQINTLTEYSNTLTSPKSLYGKGMAFGGSNKYGMAGMSYQHIGDIRRPKMTSFSKIDI